jgi:hypothetical protein
VTANDGMKLCPVLNGARFFDANAQALRMTCTNGAAARELEESIASTVRGRDQELEAMLSRELLGQRKPRNKPRKSQNKPFAHSSDG